MHLSFVGLLILFLAACSGSPDPSTERPTASKPIFFEAPSNNQVVESGEPIEVRFPSACLSGKPNPSSEMYRHRSPWFNHAIKLHC